MGNKLGTVKLQVELSQVCTECGHVHPFEATDESLKQPLARNCVECGAYIPAKLEQTAVLGVGPLAKKEVMRGSVILESQSPVGPFAKSQAEPPEVKVTDVKAQPVEPSPAEEIAALKEALKKLCVVFAGLCNVVRVSVQGSSVEFAGDLVVRDSRLAQGITWALKQCNEAGIPVVVDDAGGDDFGHGNTWSSD